MGLYGQITVRFVLYNTKKILNKKIIIFVTIMKNFTLLIFGYGETQISGLGWSIKVATSTLTKTQALIDAVWNLKPSDSQASQNFHAIIVHSYRKINYMTKDGFSVDVSDSLKVLVDNLIDELKVAHDNLPVNP